jgi:hypothetical protein
MVGEFREAGKIMPDAKIATGGSQHLAMSVSEWMAEDARGGKARVCSLKLAATNFS